MIVISSSLVLTPSAEPFGLNNPIIGWRNLVTISNVTADHEGAAHPASHLANPRTDLYWQSDEIDVQNLTVEADALEPIDYVGIAGHNFGSAGIAVSVEAGEPVDPEDPESPIDWTEIVEAVMPADDAPLILRFVPASLVSVRVRMAVGTVPPRAAVLHVGALTVLERRIYVGHTPLPFGRIIDTTQGRSQSGNFLGSIITGEHVETAVSMQNLSPAFVRDELRPWLSRRSPFFWGWRPQQYPQESGFAWFPTGHNPQPTNDRTNGMMALDFQMEGVV